MAVGASLDRRTVFFDPLCPAPYTKETLESQGLGGSEASAVRIAEALDAVLMQHCRREAQGRYQPPASAPEAEHVVVLRDARALPQIKHWFPNARFHVWLHDLLAPGSTRARWLAQAAGSLAGATLVCVSEFQRRHAAAVVNSLGLGNSVELRTIYNPIADDLSPDNGEFDVGKLVFMSSPNKGLSYALTAFQALRRVFPRLHFCVANPGYRHAPPVALPDVEWLGTLSPAQVMAQARSALCVFMPNFILPETFGLVFAEANAVGTPVLAHDCGAAREVLHPGNPVLPVRARQRQFAQLVRVCGWRAKRFTSRAGARCGVFDDYIDTLRLWRGGQRPRVEGLDHFRLLRVAQEWRKLLR